MREDSTQAPVVGPSTGSDGELVVAARSGRREAFDVLTERYFGMVYAIAYARLTHRDSAEDLAQEVFLRAYLLLDRLENPQTFCAWIGRITRNLATDWQRHSTRVARILSPEPLDTSALEVPDMTAISPSRQIEAGENKTILQGALEQLSLEKRELVLLHYMEDLSHHEIARRLGMTQSTVSRQIQQALSVLRETMTAMMRDGAAAMRARPRARTQTLALVLGVSTATESVRAALVSAAETATAQAMSVPVASGLAAKVIASAAATGKTMVALKIAAAGAAAVGLVIGGEHYLRQPEQTPGTGTTKPAMGIAVDDTRSDDSVLREAAGYANIYNIERAEEICDHVLARTTDTATQGRAHWVKALAYGRYDVQYRTQKYAEAFAREREQVRQLQPAMASEKLPVLEVQSAIYVHGKSDLAQVVANAEAKYAPTAQTDSVSAYVLGHCYLDANEQTSTSGYMDKAVGLFETAVRLRPESYEYVSYYVTALAQAGRLDEADKVGADMLKRFAAQPPFNLDQDPHCLYSAVVQMKDQRDHRHNSEASALILRERARSPQADATVHMQVALLDLAGLKNATQELKVWEGLVGKLETDSACVSGENLRSLVSAYYKFAHALNQVGRPADALVAYQKLQVYSPHYAEVHYNKGILLSVLADKEPDAAKKAQLLEEARQEFLLQTQYNWHGTAADNANKAIAKLQLAEK